MLCKTRLEVNVALEVGVALVVAGTVLELVGELVAAFAVLIAGTVTFP